MAKTIVNLQIEVEHKRCSVTQGSVIVKFNGEKIATFTDNIKLVNGEWRSIGNDRDYAIAALFPNEVVKHHYPYEVKKRQENITKIINDYQHNDYVYKVAQVLVKDEDYEMACPDNDDTWYDADDISCSTNQEELERMIGKDKLQLLNNGEIDYVVFRGDW